MPRRLLCVISLLLCGGLLCQSALATELIASQLGYHTQAPKHLVITDYHGKKANSLPKITLFNPKLPGLLPTAIGRTVYRAAQVNPLTFTEPDGRTKQAWRVDFSDFVTEGTYEVRVDGQPVGEAITLSDYVFWDGMVPILRSLYLTRSGSKVVYDGVTPILERPTSHVKDAFVDAYLANGRQTLYQDVVGGWYNGGPNYAKYSTTTAFTTALWLAAYQQAPKPWKPFKLGYYFGEPNLSDVRDILHELKHGLDWLHTMQRRDGKVYHRVDGANPVGDIRPEEDFQTRELSGLYPQDAALTTTALAMAAMAYQQSDVGYSVRCLMAAQRGWQALASMGPQSRLASRGVPYVSPSAIQHRFVAALAMYFATGDQSYQQAAKVLLPLIQKSKPWCGELSWQQPLLLATMLANTKLEVTLDPAIRQVLTPHVNQARQRLQQWLVSGRPLSLYPSNEAPNTHLAAQLTMLLAQAKPNQADWDLAAQAAYRVFGLNAYHTSFMSGLGHRPIHQPGLLLSQTLRRAIPGLVVAGPANHQPYVDTWASPANHTELATNAEWGWVLHRLNWGYNQLANTNTTNTQF